MKTACQCILAPHIIDRLTNRTSMTFLEVSGRFRAGAGIYIGVGIFIFSFLTVIQFLPEPLHVSAED